MKLDILTITFLTSLLMLAQTLAVLIQFRINKSYKKIGWWLVGSTTQALGFILMSVFYIRGVSLISMFANPLVFAGQTFLYIGITRLINIKENKWFIIISNIIFNICYFYFIIINNSITGRTIVVMTGTAILSMVTAYKLFFKYDKRIIDSARFTASVFFIYGCISLIRLFFAIILQPIKTYGLLFQNTIHIMGFIAPSIITTLWTFGFIIIVNQMLLLDIKEAKEAAERAGHAKERFLTSMSHEIRTPLNGIMGMIQIMNFTNMDKAQKKYLTIIEKESKILLNLLNNILDYSKLKHGKDILHTEKVDLREMIKELKTFFSVTINPEVDILFYTEESVPKIIMCDKIKLQEILINLIGNAIKFTEKGYIILKVSELKEKFNNQSSIVFSIEDTGIGISKNSIDKLFIEFNQAEGQNTRKYGGTGLGLVISKELVELMGGEITVNSKENIGTIFSFSVCCEVFEKHIQRNYDIEVFFINKNKEFNNKFVEVFKNIGISNIYLGENIEEFIEKLEFFKKKEKNIAIFINENAINEENKRSMKTIEKFKEDIIHMKRVENKTNIELIKTLEFPMEQEEIYTIIKALSEGIKIEKKVEKIIEEIHILEGISIMVIEDNITSREVLKELFENLKCMADFFENGKSAVNKMKEKNYDIVITDIELPDINGFDILKSLRVIDNKNGKHTPIIAISAHILDRFEEKCIDAGMDEYMAKPINLKELCAIINKHTSKSDEKIIGINREREIIKKVEPIAFRDARVSLKKIEIFLNENRYDEIKKEAHKLKGSFSSIRKKEIEYMALELSMFSDEKNKDMILKNIEEINREIILYEDSCNRG